MFFSLKVGPGHPFRGKRFDDKVDNKFLEAIKDQGIGKRSIATLLINADEDGVIFDVLFDVHGSITYADSRDDYPVENDGLWWFGFDCNHFRDATDFESLRKYHPDVCKLPDFFDNEGEIRTLEYCKEECLSLSKQLNFFKEFMEDLKNGF